MQFHSDIPPKLLSKDKRNRTGAPDKIQARRQAKLEGDRMRSRTRVNLGPSFGLWQEMKVKNGFVGYRSDATFANTLVKSWLKHAVKMDSEDQAMQYSEMASQDPVVLSTETPGTVVSHANQDFKPVVGLQADPAGEVQSVIVTQHYIKLENQADRWKATKEYLGLEKDVDLVKYLIDMFLEQTPYAIPFVNKTPQFPIKQESNETCTSQFTEEKEDIIKQKQKQKPPEEVFTRQLRKRKSVQINTVFCDIDEGSEDAESGGSEYNPLADEDGIEEEINQTESEYDTLEEETIGGSDLYSSNMKIPKYESDSEPLKSESVPAVHTIIPVKDTESPSISHPKYLVLNQPSVVNNSPVHALKTLPTCLTVEKVAIANKMGVFAANGISKFTRFGPLEGTVLMNGDDIFTEDDLSHIWVHRNAATEKLVVVDTRDEMKSNWCRYIRYSRQSANIKLTFKHEAMYFVSTEDIQRGCELRYNIDIPDDLQKRRCTKCRLNFSSFLLNHNHFYVCHQNDNLTEKTNERKRRIVYERLCEICGIYMKSNAIKRHMAIHSQIPDFGTVESMMQIIHKGEEIQYSCKTCSAAYKKMEKLRYHIRREHLVEPMVCHICGKEYPNQRKLTEHVELHKSATCKVCGKVVKRRRLAKHLKGHDDNKKSFTCDRCGKKFVDRANMLIHMLTHSKVKPFQCQEDGCSVGYTTKQCLQIHYKKAHGYNDTNMPEITRAVPFTEKGYLEGTQD